jgi:hypothetical protein
VFDFKTVFDIAQTGGQGTKKKLKFFSPTETRDNFLSMAQVV